MSLGLLVAFVFCLVGFNFYVFCTLSLEVVFLCVVWKAVASARCFDVF